MESNFNQKEKETIAFWNKNGIFERSVKNRKNSPEFVFYEGPPTANARPGIHHVLARVFKDIICRYRTMDGFRVQRRAGWDTHGLPVELQIEKKLGLAQKKDIETYGIAAFNKKCKESVWEFKKEFESLTERIGFWVDMKNPYVTYDRNYMESVWFILKEAWNKKLLFQDFKVVPYCPRCGTPLSSHEVAQGYQRVKEPSIYVKFRVIGPERKNCFLLIWTTTPWTLPANVAVAINENYQYVETRMKGQADGECLILAKERMAVLGDSYEIVSEVSGKELIGLRYEPVFPFSEETDRNAYRVIPGSFVSLQDGSGLVHIAPAFGEDDMNAVKEQNKISRQNGTPEFPVIVPVGEDGKFGLDAKQWAGLFVKDADPLIIEDLKKRFLLFKVEPYEHDYPFCWRCKTPLIYYAKKSWFIEMSGLRRELMKNNQKINWVPSYIKAGRFGEWLKEAKDWAISRERYWGTPLPIWQCQSCKKTEVIGSVSDLLSKKYSSNRYFIMRHGHSERQIKKIASCWPEPKVLPLTEQGAAQVKRSAKRLAKNHIDLIISSDIERTRQTAQIIAEATGAKIVYDKRLRDLNVGILNGKDPKLGWDYLNASANPFEAAFPKGESLNGMRKRMYEFLAEISDRYKDWNIAIVSHEFPLTMLEWTLEGLDIKDIIEKRRAKKLKRIGTAEWRQIEYRKLPFNEDMEIDLHRPYVDGVEYFCSGCAGMAKKVPDVLDVWFDSGAMPFAQAGWPRVEGIKKSGKLAPPKLFPADFISEAIDQTRGWFYTLLAISTMLGFEPSYKNVISLGHVVDPRGEKMSKSKGNIVDPWLMLEKYSADAVRWYFYTVNSPGEPKLFAEKDLDLAMKKFILTLWNCHVFLETYGKKEKLSEFSAKPGNILDRWIVSKINGLIVEVSSALDRYDVTSAARSIESFTINDLSLWYVRRSRRRLQQPASVLELAEASKVFGYVLAKVNALAAPFTPFVSEEIFQRLNGFNYKSAKSVHLSDWPAAEKSLINKILEQKMDKVREIVTLALALRAKLGIKVRQPLSKLKIKPVVSTKGIVLKLDKELLDLIKKEVNVKTIEIDQNLNEPLSLDTTITPELKEEGTVREILRHLQDARKKAGYTPKDRIVIFVQAPDGLKNLILKNEKQILSETKAKKMDFGKPAETGVSETVKTEFGELSVAIKKC